MTDETKALVERLRHVLMLYNDGHIEAAKKIIAAAIAALSRPLPGVVEGCEPSDEAWKAAQDSYENPRHDLVDTLRAAYAIDLAPRVAAAYARGVEDAAKAVRNYDTTCGEYRNWILADHFVEELINTIRALLPKEPATEDAREKEVTEHDDADPVLGSKRGNLINAPGK